MKVAALTCEQRGHPLTKIGATRFVCECGRRGAALPLSAADAKWLDEVRP